MTAQLAPAMFLTADEIVILSGMKRKATQIVALRKMGVVFFVSGAGRPVVTRTAIEGRSDRAEEKKESRAAWVPRVVGTKA